MNRADGTPPRNSYLWPTENWYPSKNHSRFTISYVALEDGRFAINGHVYHIADDLHDGRKVCYPTREAAIRASTAHCIRLMRQSRDWKHSFDQLQGPRLATAINQALAICAKETQSPSTPRPVTIAPPPPPNPFADLPLFQHP